MKLALAALSLTLSAGTVITFDDIPIGTNLHGYSEQGATFNMSYGTALATGHHLSAVPDFSNPYSFLAISFDQPQVGHTLYFQFFTASTESLFIIQTYDPTLPGLLADEVTTFTSGTIQFSTGNPTSLAIIDVGNIGFLIDNVSFATPFRTDIVPEPRHFIVIGLALAGLIWVGRRT